MRKLIHIIKANLLRQEPVHPGLPTQLRHLARLAKGVRQPARRRAPAEIALEEALAKEKLPDQGFAARDVGVVLDPAAADGVELAGCDFGLDAGPGVGVELFEPFELRASQF